MRRSKQETCICILTVIVLKFIVEGSEFVGCVCSVLNGMHLVTQVLGEGFSMLTVTVTFRFLAWHAVSMLKALSKRSIFDFFFPL